MSTTALIAFLFPPPKIIKFPLPFKMWTPYDINYRPFFLLSYLHEAIGVTLMTFVTCSVESLALTYAVWMTAMSTASIECFVMLIIVQIGGQLDIIIHRLSLLSTGFKKNSSQFIIRRYESRIVKDCVTHHNYIYDFHGQKLIEGSLAISHKIWHIDWVNLSNKTKKDLTIIMIRGGKPIKMSGSIVSEMSLATFVKVLKSSYSVYNLTCAM
ncbi:uncharacterized protein LOC122510181 [Leptopilina heterotoma]|uniref:uncharacterized protein LOC122510181 n=1 Tax=Leptopilina heterotoma TaxID=63436 RepID=UPI001CA9F4E4|nr:uncharacterized protein LOC122510181 [Leptopilina heterotoma]